MERSIEDSIFERAKESLVKSGMYTGEKKLYDYDPNFNYISNTLLEHIIEDCITTGIYENFKDFHAEHRKEIVDKETLKNVRRLMIIQHNRENLAQTIESLEKEGLLNRNDFALSMMEYAYDRKVDYDKDSFEFKIDKLKTSFWNNYQYHNPDKALILFQGTDLEATIQYELDEKKFVEDWIVGHYGTNNLMHTSRNNFYSGELNEVDFSFVIVDSILKEYGIDIEPEKVKTIFNERAQQLQNESAEKQDLNTLQKKEDELFSLETEKNALLAEKQKQDIEQGIGK